MSPTQPVDSDDSRELTSVSSMLRMLPRYEGSPDLKMRLRILASKESARRKTRVTWRQLWANSVSDFVLFANNLMRPLAIPTAGGFVSALLLFGVLAPSLATRGVVVGVQDVPTALYTEASVRSFKPLGFQNQALTVEVTIDSEGRVVDYSIPNGPASHELQRSIENYLLFTQFTPVRNFGQPVTAKVRISFQSSHIDVRG